MRIALAVEYNGKGFCGWQRQPHCLSVQESLEKALSRVADHDVTVICSGRTDTGVHAHAQIVHFDTVAARPGRAWTFGVNALLDRQIAVHWAQQVSDDFHARFSAVDRRYRFLIHNRTTRPGVDFGRVSWVNRNLDHEAMQRASSVLMGEHDFSSFRSADCQARQPVRTIKALQVSRRENLVQIDICANGFLHNMVRIIAGTLIKVGTGDRPEEWVAELLAARDRTRAGMTAPPDGLYFVQASYPEHFGIPQFMPGP